MTSRATRWLFSSLLAGAFAAACGVGEEIRVGVASEARRPDASGEGGAPPQTKPDASAGGREMGSGGAPSPPDASTSDAKPPVPACGVGSVHDTAYCAPHVDAGIGRVIEKWRFRVPLSLQKPALVANLTDDNADERIDPCDVPDVLVASESQRMLVMLSGATGTIERIFPTEINTAFSPAIGDLVGDTRPEIVVISAGGDLVALDSTGAELWSAPIGSAGTCGAVFIRDLDGDGRAEVLAGNSVFEADGTLRFEASFALTDRCQYPVATDLNGDGRLEVLTSLQVLSHTGAVYPLPTSPEPALWVAGDVIEDFAPEILRFTNEALSIFRLDGSLVTRPLQLGGCEPSLPTLIDADLDGKLDVLFRNCFELRLHSPVHPTDWSMPARSVDGAITAFDLKGTGSPMIVVSRDGSLDFLNVFPGGSETVWTEGLFANSGVPVVADVDADGSADILVSIVDSTNATQLVLLSEEQARWAPARRIWNQAAYQVDAVNEDGSASPPRIGSTEPYGLRVNARLENGHICTGVR